MNDFEACRVLENKRRESSTLAWAASNATSLSINQGIGAVTGTSRSVSPTATTTYTLTATNAGGSVTATVTVAVSAAAPPTIGSFTASPAAIAAGSSTTLAWNVSNAVTLSISGIGTVTGASASVSPSASTTYTLTATNPTGSVSASITVSVQTQLPVISSFTASPAQIASGQSSVLSWSVSQADGLKLDTAAVTGTSATVSPTATTLYTLTATNLVGSISATVTVGVGTPGSLAWKKTMVYGFGQELAEDQPGMGTTFIQSDFVGSPSVMTDPSGTVIGRSM